MNLIEFKNMDQVESQVWDQVWSQVSDQVYDQLDQLEEEFK